MTTNLFMPLWPEGQCGMFLCHIWCDLVTCAVWWQFGRRRVTSQGREAETLWATVQEVAVEVELGCVWPTYGSCCCCHCVVKGSLTMGSTGEVTCCGTSEARGFSESVRGDGSPVSFPAAAQWWRSWFVSRWVRATMLKQRPTTVIESILLNCLLEKSGLPGGSDLLCLKFLWVGWRRALLTAPSANSLGKPKGTLRQPRSLSRPEEGSKRPVPRPPRGRGVACGVVKPTMESARSALSPAAGSGPSKELPMQRHVTVVNRSVCARVCEQGERKRVGPLDAATVAVHFGTWESRLAPLQKVKLECGPVPRRETGDPLPFWMLP